VASLRKYGNHIFSEKMTNIKNALLNIQYQFSRLFNIGLNRKKFEIISNSDNLFAFNTSKNTFFSLFFTLMLSGYLFAGFIEGYINKKEVTVQFVLIFFIFGLIGLRQFLWLINGRQEMTIENRNLTLTKKGTFLTKPKIYNLDLVTNIRQAINEDNLSIIDKIKFNIGLNQKVLLRHIMGEILFDYNGKTIKVFNDLDKNERVKLINEISKRK
jgi:hypothetical protein